MRGMNVPMTDSAWRMLVAENEEQLGQMAFDYLLSELQKRPDLLLCASAGSTPTRAYQLLARHGATHPDLFTQMRVLKIDEWGGLPMDNPATCEVYLRKYLVQPLQITPGRYEGFNSQPVDARAECDRVSHWLRSHGPIDVCVLGLGVNGHLALNEPGDHLQPFAHPAHLAEESLLHPMLRDSAQQPSCGLTLGMTQILQSRRILLLVNGAHKREPFRRLMEPAISSRFPGSLLWLHPDVTVVCDRAVEAGKR